MTRNITTDELRIEALPGRCRKSGSFSNCVRCLAAQIRRGGKSGLTNLTMDRVPGVSGKKTRLRFRFGSRGDFWISAKAVVPVTGKQTASWSGPASRTSTDCQIVEIVLIWCRSSHSRYRVGERR